MPNQQKAKKEREKRRKKRRRKNMLGTPERPRLSVFRSLKNIHCQVIDDLAQETLVSASTNETELRDDIEYGGNKEAAAYIGEVIAERAKEEGIEKVVFDIGPYDYHGRVEALADAAREAGLQF